MIRKVFAHYLYINKDKLLKNGIVSFDSNGYIVDVVHTHGAVEESERLEFFNGMIVPCFVNIDISALHPNCVVVNADTIKALHKIGLEDKCKYLIINNPESIEASDIHQLMKLEGKGISIVLHFGNNHGDIQPFIFKHIRDLQELWDVRFTDILAWVTINPAKARRVEELFGSIEVNKKPGLNIISGIDYPTMRLKENSSIRVII